MTSGRTPIGDLIDWKGAAQGDVVALAKLVYWTGADGDYESFDTPHGVVLLSQTCDLVQNRERVLVAPVIELDASTMKQVRKGKKPLHVEVGSSHDRVADIERMVSLPRAALAEAVVAEHSVDERSGEDADRLSARIGRALYRYAFPDEVHDALRKFNRKITDGYGKETAFAKVLGMVDEMRISCPNWGLPGRALRIHAIVPGKLLPPADMVPTGWEWSDQTVTGVHPSEKEPQVNLERASELILLNIGSSNDAALVRLWAVWTDQLDKVIDHKSSAEVASITIETVSGAEFTWDDFKASETLDFSILSDSDAEQEQPE